jgi:hypothetical protein
LFERPYLGKKKKKKSQKKAGGMAQGEGCEFKPQYQKKKITSWTADVNRMAYDMQ